MTWLAKILSVANDSRMLKIDYPEMWGKRLIWGIYCSVCLKWLLIDPTDLLVFFYSWFYTFFLRFFLLYVDHCAEIYCAWKYTRKLTQFTFTVFSLNMIFHKGQIPIILQFHPRFLRSHLPFSSFFMPVF